MGPAHGQDSRILSNLRVHLVHENFDVLETREASVPFFLILQWSRTLRHHLIHLVVLLGPHIFCEAVLLPQISQGTWPHGNLRVHSHARYVIHVGRVRSDFRVTKGLKVSQVLGGHLHHFRPTAN